MANEKTMNSRIQHKIDTSENWAKATGFIPKKGELIIYSDILRFKVGDNSTSVVNLPFVDQSIWNQISSMNHIEATDDGNGIITLRASSLTAAEEAEF